MRLTDKGCCDKGSFVTILWIVIKQRLQKPNYHMVVKCFKGFYYKQTQSVNAI